jgi:hypothetical protein
MAASEKLIMCNALCFLVNKFGKVNAKTLKSALVDFYTGEDLSKAKKQLQKDIESLDLQVRIPRCSQHRDTDKSLTSS